MDASGSDNIGEVNADTVLLNGYIDGGMNGAIHSTDPQYTGIMAMQQGGPATGNTLTLSATATNAAGITANQITPITQPTGLDFFTMAGVDATGPYAVAYAI